MLSDGIPGRLCTCHGFVPYDKVGLYSTCSKTSYTVATQPRARHDTYRMTDLLQGEMDKSTSSITVGLLSRLIAVRSPRSRLSILVRLLYFQPFVKKTGHREGTRVSHP